MYCGSGIAWGDSVSIKRSAAIRAPMMVRVAGPT